MKNIQFSELINAIKGEFLWGDPHKTIESISIDTRKLRKGDLYFALVGKNFDGHNFLYQAIEKGASGLVISKREFDVGNPFPALPSIVRVKDTLKALGDFASYYRKKWAVPVIGVTGSNGKTTTKEMIASILQNSGSTLKNFGNFNNQIGVPLTLFNFDSQHKYAVIEMGTSSPGEIKRLTEITNPTGGVITNIGLAHLGNFKDQKDIFVEKKYLFDFLEDKGWIVLNADDPYLAGLILKNQKETIKFGINNPAEINAKNINTKSNFTYFELLINGDIIPINLPVYGYFNIYNALAAAAVSWKLGISSELIKKGLENFVPVSMRMDVRSLPWGIKIINDAYNANPSSMGEAVISFNKSFTENKKIVVLGDMLELGEKSEDEHSKLGELLSSQSFDNILLCGSMMKFAYKSFRNSNIKHFDDKFDCLWELKRLLAPNTVVFFKASRGMHFEEIIDQL